MWNASDPLNLYDLNAAYALRCINLTQAQHIAWALQAKNYDDPAIREHAARVDHS